ncbi:DNA-processing protein DprA [Candidatus Halobeggiatoa sp. HSG11]|nr:DNA-processing protein DprA [Candidatus Halobeggiatoa sp. HSG11]
MALLYAPGIGPVNFNRLIKHFGNPQNVLTAGREEWQAIKMKANLIKYLENIDWQIIESDMQWLEQPDNHALTLEHSDYPSMLRTIDDAPPILFVHGDYKLLSTQQIAIVGTRKPSKEGETAAMEFATNLSYQGFTITSGMAYGIDGASHVGALNANGKTIAVAGTGLDRVYPPRHRELAHNIAKNGGALISELPIGTTVKRQNFPIRSRIVSGLSLGVLVIEAPNKSGALYTVQHALKQGREVFVTPGSIYSPSVRGSHRLIKEGAKLVENIADILEELHIYRPPIAVPATSPMMPPKPVPKPEVKNLDNEHQLILDHLVTNPNSIDGLVELSGLDVSKISSILLMLELQGLITIKSGGLYGLK